MGRDPWVNPNPYDLEDPAGAEEDFQAYKKSMKPQEQLLQRLGVTKPQMRSASQLTWSGKGVSDSDCSLIAQIFTSSAFYTGNPTITLLSLDHNMIGDAGLTEISDALKIPNGMLANVTCLWLNSNQIGDAGTMALADALKKGALTRLQILYLNDNHISDDGAFALADAIKSSTSVLDFLRQLHLSNNRISPRGADAINKAIAKLGRVTVHYS